MKMGYETSMATVHRAHGLRGVIFVDDHLPIHVFRPDDTPNLVWADGMTRGEVRRAMRVVVEQQTFLLAR